MILTSHTSLAKRKYHDIDDLQEWGEINQWIKLEIVDTPASNKVEFKAYYIDVDGQEQMQQELSVFQKMGDKWFYVSGAFQN